MKKKLIALLTITIFFSSSLNVFAIEPLVTEEKPKQREMILQLDDTLAWINGEEYTLTSLPTVIEGRTYLPLRFMGDKLLEAQVDWDAESKKVTITKDGTKVELTIDKEEAYINGDQVQMGNTPIIIESTTYLPLRITADIFEIQTDYYEDTRQIKLVKIPDEPEEPEIIEPPTAQFAFAGQRYIAGQPVKAIDSSFHVTGRSITNRLWMINHDETKTNVKLENMFGRPNPGTYSVSLKVEAGKGNWSEWVTEEITIRPNMKPVVTAITPSKEMYASGEILDFTYTYDNESWEDIKAVRWTYRKVGEVLNRAVVEKPKYIFQPGKYMISLQLQDDFGQWSDIEETTIEIRGQSVKSELEYRFTEGRPGDIVDNFGNFNYLSYDTVIPDARALTDGSLFISNSPENVKNNGILYRDTVDGEGRILVHHHNSFTEEENLADPKKVVLIAENPTDEPAILTISNKVNKGPSSDILFVGAQLLYDYLKGAPAETYALDPGEKMYIYDSGDKRWDKGQLVSAQMDFNVTGSVVFTTAAMSRNAMIDDIASLPDLDKDVHPRGTFETTDIIYKMTADHTKPTRLMLGSGVEEWVNGYDAMTGATTQNKGNYAVDYKIEITATENTGIILNPRAGTFRGALKWDDEDVFLAPSKGYIMGNSSKSVMLGVVKAGETRTLEYSLPNGSAAPVLLVFIPEDNWRN